MSKFINIGCGERVPYGVSNRENSYSYYRSDISNTKMMSDDELDELFDKMKSSTGDEKMEYKNKIAVSFQPLIFALASKFATDGRQMDYISEGNVIFLESLDNYDKERSSLTTYMIKCLVHHFSSIYVENSGSVSGPKHLKAWMINKIKRLINEFQTKNERDANYDDILDICEDNKINISSIDKDYLMGILMGYNYVYVDSYKKNYDDDSNDKLIPKDIFETLSTEYDDTVFNANEEYNLLIDELNKYAKTISNDKDRNRFLRNVEILKEHYGIGDGEEKSINFLATKYNLTTAEIGHILRELPKTILKCLGEKQLCA